MEREVNKHHVLFPRYIFTSSPDLKKLRGTKELIVPIAVGEHKLLHREIEQVPAPDHHMVKRIAKEFYPERNDPIATIRNLEHAVDLAMTNRYTSDLAVRLGLLIMSSLEAQIPFIERGLDGGVY